MSLNKIIILVSFSFILLGCAKGVKEEQLAEPGVSPMFQADYEDALKSLRSGDLEDAKAKFRTLHTNQPQYAGPLVNLGIVAYQEKRYEQATAYFEKALELKPNHTQALNYMGVLARIDGRFGEAEGYYRHAIKIDPNYRLAIRNLGILLDLYGGRIEEALALYERYQSLQDEPDPKVKEWIFDIKQRLK